LYYYNKRLFNFTDQKKDEITKKEKEKNNILEKGIIDNII